MNVNRAWYYKWLSRKGLKNQYEKDRELLTQLLTNAHQKHRSYRYHKLALMVRKETGLLFSDYLAHKCCKSAGIKAQINHYNCKRPNVG